MSHVEPEINTEALRSQFHMQYKEQFNLIDEMVGDAFEVNVAYDELQDFDVEELLNKKAQKFY